MKHFLLLLTLAFFSATAAPAAEDLYHPLSVGLRWEVAVDVAYINGKASHGKAIRTITGTKTVEGKTYYVTTTQFEGMAEMQEFSTLRRKTAEGVYVINLTGEDRTERLETPLPLEVGKTWEAGDGVAKTIYKVEKQETVRVGERTYEKSFRISYVTEGRGVKGSYVVAPRVGNIKEELTQEGNAYQFNLLSFTTVKPAR